MKELKTKLVKLVDDKINDLMFDLSLKKQEIIEEFEEKEKELEVLKANMKIEIEDLVNEKCEEYIKYLQVDGDGRKQKIIEKFKEGLKDVQR